MLRQHSGEAGQGFDSCLGTFVRWYPPTVKSVCACLCPMIDWHHVYRVPSNLGWAPGLRRPCII